MNKWLFAIFLICLFCLPAMATEVDVPKVIPLDDNGIPSAVRPEANNTLLSAVIVTGAGTAKDLGFTTSQHTCLAAWGGTAPTDLTFNVEGSIDNSTFEALYSATMTATPVMTHVVNKPVRYIRGNYVSKSDGDATTSITITCTSGGN